MANKILVVEDEEINRNMFRQLLDFKGYKVVTAMDGEDGWKKFQTSKTWNLIIVDLIMPKLSGSDLIARINDVLPDVPKIIISGQGTMDDALTAITQDVFFYFKKPIREVTEFYHIIEKALEKDALIRKNRKYQNELKRANLELRKAVKTRTKELEGIKNKLTFFFDMANRIQREKDIQTKLDLTAQAIFDAELFRRVIVPLEKERGKIDAIGMVGLSKKEINALLNQPKLTESIRKKILEDKFRISQSYFIPEEAQIYKEIPSRYLPGVDNGNSQEWRVNDLFIIPMRRRDNSILGYMSADEPFDGKRPQLGTVQILEQFVSHVTLSIEQILLEKEVEQSEKKYRNLIENVSDAIYSVDVEGKFTFMNELGAETIGYHRDEILGKDIMELIVEDSKEIVRKQFQRVLKGEEVKIDIPLYHKNGSERIVTAVIQPQWENEVVIGAFGVARDITKRHHLEKRISESEAKYRSLMEHANDAILLVDSESVQIVQANQMASALTGYSQKELIGKSILDLRRPEDRDYAMDRFGHILLHGSGYFEDAPIIKKDGTPVRVEISGRIVEIEGQKILQSIMRDVTEPREMEEELRQRVSQLSILTEITDVLQMTLGLNDVLSIILTGVTAGQGFGFNRAFILFLDDDEKALRGQVAIGPSNLEEAGRIWGELSQEPRTLREMLEYYREVMTSEDVMVNKLVRNITIDIADTDNVFARAIKDKMPVNVTDVHQEPAMPKDILDLLQVGALAIIPLVSRDKVLGLLLVDNMINQLPITDEDVDLLRVFANSSAIAIENARLVSSLEEKVVDLKEAYKELKDSRDRLVKTEKLSAVGEVATSVAHEIRNPLVSIGGFAQTVLGKMEEGDARRQYLEIIVDEVRRLESILGEILNYARPVVPHFMESDLNEMIRQTMGMIRVEIDEEMIEMISNLAEELPKLWFDPDQMRQVLLNLLRNAVHAMPDGGELTVSTEIKSNIVTIEIRDTGVGISDEHISKIFTAFFTTKSTGSGLGLTICSQILHNHGGSIGVSSKEDEGSAFVISLPLRRKSGGD